VNSARIVLVVDDEASVRKLIVTFLERSGFKTMQAQNGLEAVEVYGSYHSDIGLVITDLEMPVMNGLEEIERMRSIDPGVRVLVVSGYGQSVSNRLSGCGVVTKPFTPAALLDYVNRVLAA
jgi:two-component system cell cycle sensor histidine kinase/response regulator CckA